MKKHYWRYAALVGSVMALLVAGGAPKFGRR